MIDVDSDEQSDKLTHRDSGHQTAREITLQSVGSRWPRCANRWRNQWPAVQAGIDSKW